MLGIELNEYAAELARVTVWIGELQWRLLHGYEFKTHPVLEPLDHIECRDALLDFPAELPLPPGEGRGEGSRRAVEAAWPKADIVIGNPPFLGDKKMRAELGGDYAETLRAVYKRAAFPAALTSFATGLKKPGRPLKPTACMRRAGGDQLDTRWKKPRGA